MAGTDARKPLQASENGTRAPTRPTVSGALKEAIETLSTESLRKELEFLCHRHPDFIQTLERRLLVQGKDVVRYHVDTESEDNTNSESEGSESEDDAGKEEKPIAIEDEEYTARMAACQNCKEEFDVTLNDRGDCVWHPGLKSVDYESDFWADHDEDCHGPYESFTDDPDFAEGFMWDCCDMPGDDEGCKSTKHKARVNLVVAAPSPILVMSKKRKAEAEKLRTSSKKGRKV